MFNMPVLELAKIRRSGGRVAQGLPRISAGAAGIRERPNRSVQRDIALAEMTARPSHLSYERGDVAESGSRREAARRRVTCEVAPHHFTLTDDRSRRRSATTPT